MYTSTATLKCNPHKHGIKKGNAGWLVALCEMDISLYYRRLYFMEYYIWLNVPAWGPHISIIRAETPNIQKFDGMRLTYQWERSIISDEVHFWMPACSPTFDEIRAELNLGPSLVHPHITILNKKGL